MSRDFDELIASSKVSPRLRINIHLRNGPEDQSQRMLNVEKDRLHSPECLEIGSVLFECKDGAYFPLKRTS